MNDPLEPYRNVPRPATPGPWRTEEDGPPHRPPGGPWMVRVGEFGLLADVWGFTRETDARAIAALPEMLERYDRLVRAVEVGRDADTARTIERIDAVLRGEA